jgi:hypothetical protein
MNNFPYTGTDSREANKILNNGIVGEGHMLSFNETTNSVGSLGKLNKAKRGSIDSR